MAKWESIGEQESGCGTGSHEDETLICYTQGLKYIDKGEKKTREKIHDTIQKHFDNQEASAILFQEAEKSICLAQEWIESRVGHHSWLSDTFLDLIQSYLLCICLCSSNYLQIGSSQGSAEGHTEGEWTL